MTRNQKAGLVVTIAIPFAIGLALGGLLRLPERMPKGYEVQVTDLSGNHYYSNNFSVDEERGCVSFTDQNNKQRAWCDYPTQILRLK